MSSLAELYLKAQALKRGQTVDEGIQYWFDSFCLSLVNGPDLWSTELMEMKQVAIDGKQSYYFDVDKLLVKHPLPIGVTIKDLITFLSTSEDKHLEKTIEQPNNLLHGSRIMLNSIKSVRYNALGYEVTGFRVYLDFYLSAKPKGYCLIL